MKFSDFAKHEFKLFIRNKWNIPLLIPLFVFLILTYSTGYKYFDSPYLLSATWVKGSSYLLISHLLYFLLVSYNFMEIEFKSAYREMFSLYNLSLYKFIISKLMILLLLALLVLGVHLALIIMPVKNDIPENLPFIINTLIAFFSSWGIGIFVAICLGLFIGYFVQSPFAYIIILFSWIFITPYNGLFFNYNGFNLDYYIYHHTHISMLWNMLLSDIGNYYDNFVGFIVDYVFYLEKIFKIIFGIFLLSVIFSINRLKTQMLQKKPLISSLLLASILIFIGIKYNSYSNFITLTEGPYKGCTTSIEEIYFENELEKYKKKISQHNNERTLIKILNYNLDLFLKEDLQVKANLLIKNVTNHSLTNLQLTLHENFLVKEIKIKGYNLNFNRNMNYLIINLNEPLLPREEINVKIIYKGDIELDGIGRKAIFIKPGLVMLPEYIAWYPLAGHQKIAEVIDNYDLLFKPNYQSAMFDLKIKSADIVYSNIPTVNFKQEQKYFYSELKGKNQGVYLLSSNLLKEYSIGNCRVIAPLVFKEKLPDLVTFLNQITLNKKYETILICPICLNWSQKDVAHSYDNYFVLDNKYLEGQRKFDSALFKKAIKEAVEQIPMHERYK